MAHAKDEANENHWPGYVDALTTMLMVLTFVMMILGIALFAMSQNVSRVLVETIARAAQVEPKGDSESVPELTDRILDTLKRQPPRPPVVGLERAMSEQGPAREAGPGQPVTPSIAGEDRRVVSELPAFVPGTPGPVMAAVQGAGLVLEFQPRATRLDDASSAKLSETLATEGSFRDAPLLEVRAAINRSAAGLSDARRVAYYRAMLVRSAILKSGVPPDRVRVLIDETDKASGDAATERVRVIPLRTAPSSQP
ncbi:MAG: hypothetical protein ACOVN4_06470 [Bosea sp. (in: a-proteobacteria)]|jgi:hypothetical protein